MVRPNKCPCRVLPYALYLEWHMAEFRNAWLLAADGSTAVIMVAVGLAVGPTVIEHTSWTVVSSILSRTDDVWMRRATLDETLLTHPFNLLASFAADGLDIAGEGFGARHVTWTGGATEMPSILHAVNEKREYYGRTCAARPWKLPIPRLQLVSRVIILPEVQVHVLVWSWSWSTSTSTILTCSPAAADPRAPRHQAHRPQTTGIETLRLLQMLSCPMRFSSFWSHSENTPLRPGRTVIRLGNTSLFSSNNCSPLSSNRSAAMCDCNPKPC